MIELTIARFASTFERQELEPYLTLSRSFLRSIIAQGHTKLEDERGRRKAVVEDVDSTTTGTFTFDTGRIRASVGLPIDFGRSPVGHSFTTDFVKGTRDQILEFVLEECRARQPNQGIFAMPHQDVWSPKNFGVDYPQFWLVDGALDRALIGKDGDAYWLGRKMAESFRVKEVEGVSFKVVPEGILAIATSHEHRSTLKETLGDVLFTSGKRYHELISMPHFMCFGESVPAERTKEWNPSMSIGHPAWAWEGSSD